MKKDRIIFAAFLLMTCVCALLLSAALTSGAEQQRLNIYDVNFDGVADVSDVTALLDYLAFGCEHTPVVHERVEPTCASPGVMAYSYCSKCGQALEEVVYIDPLPHQIMTVSGKEPTCGEDGYTEMQMCTVCKKVIRARETIPATGDHTPVIIPASAPTCAETGLSEGSYCAVCEKVLTEQQVIPATGAHTPGVLPARSADCTHDGLSEGSFCTVCGAVLASQEITEEHHGGHNFVDGVCTKCHMTIEKGASFFFGTYEQDDDKSTIGEEIEWIVLDIFDGKALLLSRYALDAKPYHPYNTAVTWENCALRSWLNETFCDGAFNAAEKGMILETPLENADNPVSHVAGGGDTVDRVFLLSIDDVTNPDYGFYRGNKTTYDVSGYPTVTVDYNYKDEARQCTPTAYALSQGLMDINGGCHWRLRSPGGWNNYSAIVWNNGAVAADGGAGVRNLIYSGIRPAIVISLENA